MRFDFSIKHSDQYFDHTEKTIVLGYSMLDQAPA